MQFARHRTSGTYDDSVLARYVLHRADHLHVSGQLVAVFGRIRQRIDFGKPVGLQSVNLAGGYVVFETVAEFFQSDQSVRLQRNGPVLHGVIRSDVKGNQPALGIGKQPPRPSGEILEPGPDADHHVCFGANRVGRLTAGDTDGAEI